MRAGPGPRRCARPPSRPRTGRRPGARATRPGSPRARTSRAWPAPAGPRSRHRPPPATGAGCAGPRRRPLQVGRPAWPAPGWPANSWSTCGRRRPESTGRSKRRLSGPSVVRASSTGGATTQTRSPGVGGVWLAMVSSPKRPLTVGQVAAPHAELVLRLHRLAGLDQLLARLAAGLVGEARAELGQQRRRCPPRRPAPRSGARSAPAWSPTCTCTWSMASSETSPKRTISPSMQRSSMPFAQLR